MKVKECVSKLANNGTKRCYDDRLKVYVNLQSALDRDVKNVTYHKGYGYEQTNAVIHI